MNSVSNFRWRVRRRLHRRAELREATEHLRELSDQRDNELSALPADEKLDWTGFWAAEIYMPSHAERLVKGLDDLGLASGGPGRQDLKSWIRDTRPGAGAWANLGFFSKPGRFMPLPGPKIEVPGPFVSMQLGLHQVAAGISVLVIQFVLEDQERKTLEEVMRRDFHAEARPTKGGGYKALHANSLKEEKIAEFQGAFRSVGIHWIEDHLPGAFSGLPEVDVPVWDLLLSEKELVFKQEPSSYDWRDALGFSPGGRPWKASEAQGLFLFSPSGLARSSSVPCFTAVRSEILHLLREETDDVHALAYRLHQGLGGVLAALAVVRLMTGYEKRFARIRDELADPSSFRRIRRRLATLQCEVFPLMFDLETLERAGNDEQVQELLALERATDFTLMPRPFPKKQVEQKDIHLIESLRDKFPERSSALAELARGIAGGLRTQTELLLAGSNIRLQWAVAILTVLAAVAGVYATVASS